MRADLRIDRFGQRNGHGEFSCRGRFQTEAPVRGAYFSSELRFIRLALHYCACRDRALRSSLAC